LPVAGRVKGPIGQASSLARAIVSHPAPATKLTASRTTTTRRRT